MKIIKNCQGSMVECLPLEFGKDTVYVRENIKRITIENMELWQYDETQYSLEEYDKIKINNLETKNATLEQAIVELTLMIGGATNVK